MKYESKIELSSLVGFRTLTLFPNETSTKLALNEYLFSFLFTKNIPANCVCHFTAKTCKKNSVCSPCRLDCLGHVMAKTFRKVMITMVTNQND